MKFIYILITITIILCIIYNFKKKSPIEINDLNKIDCIYIVSIKRSYEFRKENINYIQNYFKNKNIKIIGVDGNNLTEDDINKYKKDNIFKNKFNYSNKYKRYLKLGELGCSLSHYKIWMDIIKNNYDNCLVLEDDAKLISNFNDEINNIFKSISNDYNFISLFHHPQQNFKKENNKSISLIKKDYFGTVGYIISNKGAKVFIKNLFPIDQPIDSSIMEYSMKNNNLYILNKSLITLYDTKSLIR